MVQQFGASARQTYMATGSTCHATSPIRTSVRTSLDNVRLTVPSEWIIYIFTVSYLSLCLAWPVCLSQLFILATISAIDFELVIF